MSVSVMLPRRVASAVSSAHHIVSARCLSTSSSLSQKDGWFNKLLVRKIEPTKESHSRMLSDKEAIYELTTHNLKPGSHTDYLNNYKEYVAGINDHPEMNMSLQGSWTVGVGDQDQVLHLWRYHGGYQAIDTAKSVIDKDESLQSLLMDRTKFMRSRSNQFLLPFSFWPQTSSRDGPNIYEIRSYYLKPGTMIEWGNNWARAIQFRQSNNEAFGGFFSQVGRLYNVHHIWCYGSLAARKEAREAAWRHPGWDEVVAYTVPLIEEMHTRVLYPNDISPAQ